MAAKKQPWAILVCKFSDDVHPADVFVKDLPQMESLDRGDTQTALDLFEQFFTTKGIGTFNAVRYFNEMSHGAIDLDASKVFVVDMPWTLAQNDQLGVSPGGAQYSAMITTAAQVAALSAGVPLEEFYGLVITSHAMLAMAQGGWIPGGAVKPGPVGWCGLDYRWVRNNGIQAFGQEMGHGFGLDHSRHDGDPNDYQDQCDVMSTRNAFSGVDPDYGMRGPGINAWNMRCRGWLDETRVWHPPAGSFPARRVTLRPLHRKELPGFLTAELPPLNSTSGFPRYLVEYRKSDRWDSGLPFSCVQVHRFEGAMQQFFGTHSYVMDGTAGQTMLRSGDVFSPGSAFLGGPTVVVVEIDDANDTATIEVALHASTFLPPTFDPFWWVKTHGGLTPPGPGTPWLHHFSAALALAETANAVPAELRADVLELALRQLSTTKDALKTALRQARAPTRKAKRSR